MLASVDSYRKISYKLIRAHFSLNKGEYIFMRFTDLYLSFVKDLCIHSPASLTRKSCSKLAEIPGYLCRQKWWGVYFCWQISWLADLLTVTKSSSRFTPHFCQQICWLTDLPAVIKSASRFTPYFCQQICWLADLLTVSKSFSTTKDL